MNENLRELPNAKETSQQLLILPLKSHEEFDIHWREEGHRYSFHNRSHIEAVENAFFTYLSNFSQENDPLAIYEDLKKWNESHKEIEPINLYEFKEILRWAIRYHDTGNIAKEVEITEGQLTFKYLTDENGKVKYTAADAEERSKKILEIAIRYTDMDDNKKQRYIALAQHLIEQTKFSLTPENQNTPFARSMRFFDQIGNGLFNENQEMIIGLLEEMINEKPDAEINPYYFLNFTRLRPKELGIDEEQLNGILQILQRKLPPENSHYQNEKVKAKDFLNQTKQNLHP